MMSLESDDWSQLTHAYGAADDIPHLLAQLAGYPSESGYDAEPFFSLWSSLCHQGDTYTAAYAAVPHIVALAEAAPDRITYDYLLLPTSIEIARLTGRGPEVPAEMIEGYFTAIKNMAAVVGRLSADDMDEAMCLSCGAAVAIAAGKPVLAEAILELEGDTASEFLKWKSEQ
ncbi:MAG: hypothetical protein QNJ14_11775 [Woeseiaceae bacterium]|nr:hypothetical protein [Woeseiaceae bacterium]